MNFAEYQTLAEVTVNKDLNRRDRLAMVALGLGEAGEVQNLIKKRLYHGHELDKEELESEMGDVLWYLAAMANTFGMSLERIAEKNIEKLRARYPQGFSEYDSINRKV